jgi:pimeloyl-ACP methyl ester carboxylesterase
MHIANELRVGAELTALIRSTIWQKPPMIGNGTPVLLIPGLMANDGTLRYLSQWLQRAGFEPHGSTIVCNVNCSERTMAVLERELMAITADRSALVIGHSRGGMLAQALAVRHPDRVLGIATLGSPLVDPLHSINPLMQLHLLGMSQLGSLLPGVFAGRGCTDYHAYETPGRTRMARMVFGRSNRHRYETCKNHCCEQFWNDLHAPWPTDVRFLSVNGTHDGIVSKEATEHPAAQHVSAASSHCGMIVSAPVLRAILPWLMTTARTPRSPVTEL